MKTKLVIFDLDGVLVDTREIWFTVWKNAFKIIGKDLSFDEFNKDCWGTTFPQVCRQKGMTDEQYKKAEKVFLESAASGVEKMKVFDGVPEMMSRLKKDGIKSALLTNNRKFMIKRILDAFNLDFDCIPYLYEIQPEPRPKPDPFGIEFIIEKLDVKKGEAIFIGDTPVDEETGKRAGVKTLIIGKDIDKVTDILEQI